VGCNVDYDVIKAYNKMHVTYGVQVEWRIGGLKRKWKWLMKRFDSTKTQLHICLELQFFCINDLKWISHLKS
jgi:hypothetical protein